MYFSIQELSDIAFLSHAQSRSEGHLMQEVSTLWSTTLLLLLHHLLSAPPVTLALTPGLAKWRLPPLRWRRHLGERAPAFNFLLPSRVLLWRGVVGLASGGGRGVPWLCPRPRWSHFMWPHQLLILLVRVCVLVVVLIVLVIILLPLLFQLKDLGHRPASALLQAWPSSS